MRIGRLEVWIPRPIKPIEFRRTYCVCGCLIITLGFFGFSWLSNGCR